MFDDPLFILICNGIVLWGLTYQGILPLAYCNTVFYEDLVHALCPWLGLSFGNLFILKTAFSRGDNILWASLTICWLMEWSKSFTLLFTFINFWKTHQQMIWLLYVTKLPTLLRYEINKQSFHVFILIAHFSNTSWTLFIIWTYL